MSQSVPDSALTEFQLRLQAISELVAYLGHADPVNREDPREWYRSVLRGLADIAEEAGSAERYFSNEAMRSKALGPTEIAKAARISRAALYKRKDVLPDRQEE